jgi:hypothetical protein
MIFTVQFVVTRNHNPQPFRHAELVARDEEALLRCREMDVAVKLRHR